MKIDMTNLSVELKKCMLDKKISVVELSNKSKVSRETIYSIMDNTRDSVQIGTLRNLAEALDVDFKIAGKRITFFKKQQQANNEVLTDREQELLSIFRKASEAEKNTMLNFLEGLCDLLAKSRATATEKGG